MNKLRLLLIDDDEDDREIFQIALNTIELPIEYLTAESGSIAVQILHELENAPEFIFLDLNMPLMSGKECLSYIRSVQKYELVPIIIFTTSSYHEDVEECRKLGATHFLTKTHDIDHLSTLISQILKNDVNEFTLL